MNKTFELLQMINAFFAMTGEKPLQTSPAGHSSELGLLREVKAAYKARLMAKVPQYESLPSEHLIPDALLAALRQREQELEGPVR